MTVRTTSGHAAKGNSSGTKPGCSSGRCRAPGDDRKQDGPGEASVRQDDPEASSDTNTTSPGTTRHFAIEDLTGLAMSGAITPAVLSEATPLDRAARVLCRRSCFHVLLVGDRGVGKSTVLRELARQAACGDRPLLADKRFVRLDCTDVSPDESRAVLDAIASNFLHAPAFASDRRAFRLVVCLDGVASLLRRPNGGTNVAEFVAALRRSAVPVVGVLSPWEYADLLAGHADVREFCTKIDVVEPSDDAARAILAQHAPRLEKDFGIAIPEPVRDRGLALASSFLLNERQPAKSLRVLRLACEEATYDRAATNWGESGMKTASDCTASPASLDTETLVDVLADLTGIPCETIAGTSPETDFRTALAARVVGQSDPVHTVADELQLIRGGLTDPNKPASVLLFAGLTGVGKTELAKAVAELYSGSKRLNVYAMGNYTEPHSVSGILGVPPGYVGHEYGGRLINELNSDPYAVFLLDEAEKAHPNVWKPFLNLFDEGWIEDPRGVRAYADRAIFILTTNAGSDSIAHMTQNGASEAEIEERVNSALARVKQERSAQPVFTPQFLARMKRVLVFRPLDEPAMTGIARKLVGQVQKLWLKKRDQLLEVDESLIEWIGRQAHALNQKSGNKEGGRIIRKLIRDTIDSQVQQALNQWSPDQCRGADVQVELDVPLNEIGATGPEAIERGGSPKVRVSIGQIRNTKKVA